MNIVELSGVHYEWNPEKLPNGTNRFHLKCDEFIHKRGESVFLRGVSGSGKSTLLGLICGTIKPQQGRVIVAGQCISEMRGPKADTYRADMMGIIFQNFNLVPYLNAIQNIMLPLRYSISKRSKAGKDEQSRIQRAEYLLENLGFDVSRDANSTPDQLSIGQQQRVAVARALIGGPELILADEPTSALDDENQGKFIKLLLSQVKENDASLIMVSHNKRLKDHFDRVVTLDNGELKTGYTK